VRIPLGYEADALRHTLVSEVMTTFLQTVPSDMVAGELARRIAEHDPEVSRHQASLLVNSEGELAGIITRGDLVKAIESGMANATVAEAGTINPVVVFPDESVHQALSKLLQHDIGRLPVVDPAEPKKIVGYLGRSHILSARLSATNEETVREPGWLRARG